MNPFSAYRWCSHAPGISRANCIFGLPHGEAQNPCYIARVTVCTMWICHKASDSGRTVTTGDGVTAFVLPPWFRSLALVYIEPTSKSACVNYSGQTRRFPSVNITQKNTRPCIRSPWKNCNCRSSTVSLARYMSHQHTAPFW